MSETIYYKTITISTGAFVEIELAIRLEIATLERRLDYGNVPTIGREVDIRRLADLRSAFREFSA